MDDKTMHIQKMIHSYVQGSLTEEEIMNLWAECLKDPALADQLEIEVAMKHLLEGKDEAE